LFWNRVISALQIFVHCIDPCTKCKSRRLWYSKRTTVASRYLRLLGCCGDRGRGLAGSGPPPVAHFRDPSEHELIPATLRCCGPQLVPGLLERKTACSLRGMVPLTGAILALEVRHGGNHAERVMKSFAVGMLVCVTLGGTAVAADVPNLIGTWKPTGESAGARIGHSHAGWAAASEPVFNPTPRPFVVVEKQNGRGLSGYEVLPDGRKDPFVGVFKRDGKQIIVSTELGAATADVVGDEIEWCWHDNLPTVSVAVCDVMKKAQ